MRSLRLRIKKEYPHISNYLVIPYLSFNVYNSELFDSIIYPDDFEKYHFKAAIPARNKFMVDNASYAICYVNHGWGGAAKTYERAKKKGLNIINFGNYDLKVNMYSMATQMSSHLFNTPGHRIRRYCCCRLCIVFVCKHHRNCPQRYKQFRSRIFEQCLCGRFLRRPPSQRK